MRVPKVCTFYQDGTSGMPNSLRVCFAANTEDTEINLVKLIFYLMISGIQQ
jgi:hypothetical protein